MERLNKYPAFYYGTRYRTAGRVVLADVQASDELLAEILAIPTIDGEEIRLLDGWMLSSQLEELLERSGALKADDLLTVFPGNGSRMPRDLMDPKPNAVSVQAKRAWIPGQPPTVTVGAIPTGQMDCSAIRRVVVIDDVISSGLTIRELYAQNAYRFPDARWFAATWVSQMPRDKAASGATGYDQVVAACLLEGTRGRVPVNSLSTLLEHPEIAESYAARHFEVPSDFLEWLQKVSQGR